MHGLVYHLLDPVWRRVPFPITPRLRIEPHGPVQVIRMERTWLGRVLLPVHAYLVGDTLVDTGIDCLGAALVQASLDRGLRSALVTHHHEDHAGNAARLLAAGVLVSASPETAKLVAAHLPIKFYQHLVWGSMTPAAVRPLGAETVIGGRLATVLPAPGHCTDQVVFHVPSEGWLFSGDAFIHEQVRIFRGDEDFYATLATLERLIALDFDTLYCAHRPRLTNGKAALAQKRQWLQDLEGEARVRAARGQPVRQIVDALGLRPRSIMPWLTLGDAAPDNLIRAILTGPVPRPEVVAVVGHG